MEADASIAKERRPSPGLEGVNDFDVVLPVGPLVALEALWLRPQLETGRTSS